MQKTIYIIRHGETDFNRRRIIQGSGVDSSLNATGKRQAQAFYTHYAKQRFDVVLTSQLKRTQETMAPFLETGLPWESFAELNEMSWGIYEGQSSTPEMKANYHRMTQAWKNGDYEVKIPGGESAQALANRLGSFVDHLRQRPEERILICSHGRAMRCLMTLLHEEPLSQMDQYHHDNTGLYLVDYQPEVFTLKLRNDVRHLAHLSKPE